MSHVTDEVAESGVGPAEPTPPDGGDSPSGQGLAMLAFLAPAFIFVGIFVYYPMLVGSQMAFRQWSLWDLTNTPWIGFGNFRTLISDPLFPG